jgi:hypothetical protein
VTSVVGTPASATGWTAGARIERSLSDVIETMLELWNDGDAAAVD